MPASASAPRTSACSFCPHSVSLTTPNPAPKARCFYNYCSCRPSSPYFTCQLGAISVAMNLGTKPVEPWHKASASVTDTYTVLTIHLAAWADHSSLQCNKNLYHFTLRGNFSGLHKDNFNFTKICDCKQKNKKCQKKSLLQFVREQLLWWTANSLCSAHLGSNPLLIKKWSHYR